jgi:hypothetical protein
MKAKVKNMETNLIVVIVDDIDVEIVRDIPLRMK